MGAGWSEPPPPVVLVPPRWGGDGGGAEAAALARGPAAPGPLGRGAFRELFGAHLGPEHAARMRLRVPGEGLAVAAAVRSGGGAGGAGRAEVVWQPVPPRSGGALASPHTFLAIAAEAGHGGWSAVRGCAHSPAAGLAVFGTLPLYLSPAGAGRGGKAGAAAPGPSPPGWHDGERPRGAALGARLGSDDVALGFELDPTGQADGRVWAAARARGLAAAVECDVGPRALGGLAEGARRARGAAPGAALQGPELSLARLPELWKAAPGRENLRASVSYTATPGGAVGGAGRGGVGLTAAAEYNRGRSMRFGILTHSSVRRKVRNLFEDPSVVGIANYWDLGVLLETPLGPGRAGEATESGGGSTAEPDLALAASLQMNEHSLVKCSVGGEGVRAALALRSWWSPSLCASATAHWAWGAPEPRCTFALSIDAGGGDPVYERPDPQQTFGAPTQKHAASRVEILAGSADGRPLVLGGRPERPAGA